MTTSERKAIDTFVNMFSGSCKKLGPDDVDYKVFNAAGELIAYAEVIVGTMPIRSSYPLSIAADKLVKLVAKRLNPVIVWACEDGIIYGRVELLVGTARFSGGADYGELTIYYDKQRSMKYVRFIP